MIESPATVLPAWATEAIALYECNAVSQFILYGNVNDRVVLPPGSEPALGSLADFLLRVLLPRFDVVLSYDLGNGIRVEKGGEAFGSWPRFREDSNLPKAPRAAVETLTHYFRYAANLARLDGARLQVGCVIHAAHLLAPALPGGFNYDLNALALLIRDWSADGLLTGHPLATFLLTENLHDLHPLLVNNPRAAALKVPLPSPDDLARAFTILAGRHGSALAGFADGYTTPARMLAGATLGSVERLVKTTAHQKRRLTVDDLAGLRQRLVEQDCQGLIEFVEPRRTLHDLHGLESVKAWLRQDVALWRAGDLAALPMGYLLCGPVGTGKTFLAECLAGEAGRPVVKLGNFRDKWVGSTESNLEKVIRLLHALGSCIVFIDEADQALGRRGSDSGDAGVSGRVYSMLAQEMSDSRNRGRIVWCLATSRPDLIEVDLKRPGRIDVKIPLFPTATAREGFDLLQALCNQRGVSLPTESFTELEPLIPEWLTPGAAESLAVKAYRRMRSEALAPAEALRQCLVGYQPPVARDVLAFQIRLAAAEASDREFVPAVFRG
jgi:ATPase family associated with various cellular activities (AAA)